MRQALLGLICWAAGLVFLATGVLTGGDLRELADRLWPILLFVAAITVVAELCASAGVFVAVADAMLTAARGRIFVLWLYTAALVTATTVFLSLDTTVVLLTPVVVALAVHAKISPVPFALTTVWIANTGSMLLPVSNLTNLLAADRVGAGTLEFARHTWPLQLIGVAAPLVVVFAVHRRELRQRRAPASSPTLDDPALAATCGAVLLAVIGALLAGAPPWLPAVIAAAVLAGVFAVRRPARVRASLIPWPLLVFVTGLFVLITALLQVGGSELIGWLLGDGEGASSIVRHSLVATGPGIWSTTCLPTWRWSRRPDRSRPCWPCCSA